MGFRFRLAWLMVATLVAVQLATAILVYSVTRRELIEEGKRRLGTAATAFGRQVDDVSGRVAASVQVLALDYALRSAIAQHDEATVRSALANHGRRVGATRMQLVGVDGRVTVDTAVAHPGADAMFAHPRLLDRALDRPASAVVAISGRAYWIVAVPVFAPDLVAVVAATLPLDEAVLSRLQEQSALPRNIELASRDDSQGWTALARGRGSVALDGALRTAAPDGKAHLVQLDGEEYLVQAVSLAQSPDNAPVAAVLGYSVDEALSAYRPVALAWAILLGLGLSAGVLGAFLIARRVSRPVEALAASARRIEAGDYAIADGVHAGDGVHHDEIGALSSAFSTMAGAIREREARILHQAGHDPVTGLANRLATAATMDAWLGGAGSAPAALLLIGLGRLAEVVKTVGHDVGDRLLKDAAARLEHVLAPLAPARASDSEFAVFIPDVRVQDAIATAFRCVDALSAPYQESGLSVDMAPAVGIALAPEHGEIAATLLRRAGVALLTALSAEDPTVVYDPATDPHRPDRLSLMTDLREAVDHDQLRLHYQPKLNLATGRIDGAEGLARWNHPRLGSIPPDRFIGLAEETGNLRRVTRWALATGIAQAARWSHGEHSIRVGINVSARDLGDDELPRRVADLLAAHRVKPSSLLLEVTESAVMDHPDTAIRTLRRLADQGIDLAIDDFGVGQSSFAYLRQLPVAELKIDRLFTRRIAEAAADRAIVRSIVELGHNLGLRVTAEGVEDEATLEFLVEIGCDHAQGYWISPPVPEAAFADLASTWRGTTRVTA